jgi:uncharacterized membrane protein
MKWILIPVGLVLILSILATLVLISPLIFLYLIFDRILTYRHEKTPKIESKRVFKPSFSIEEILKK